MNASVRYDPGAARRTFDALGRAAPRHENDKYKVTLGS